MLVRSWSGIYRNRGGVILTPPPVQDVGRNNQRALRRMKPLDPAIKSRDDDVCFMELWDEGYGGRVCFMGLCGAEIQVG
jgi:hypothetical protein